jgi:hypothetical protein
MGKNFRNNLEGTLASTTIMGLLEEPFFLNHHANQPRK